MEREAQLKFCKICREKKFDVKQGVICGLTNAPADFEDSCESFNENTELKLAQEKNLKEKELGNQAASQGTRFLNHILDSVFFFILVFILSAVLGVIVAIVSPDSLLYLEQDSRLFNYLWGFVLGMIYYSSFEYATGRTIAKYITKTKVVDYNGEKPDFGTILTRSLCRFVPFEALSFLGSDGSGWHDKWSKTLVVNVEKKQMYS